MKKFTMATLILGLCLMLTACGGKESKNLSKIEKIKKAGKIVLGTSAGYPPFEFHKVVDGKDSIIGVDLELAQAVADEIGVDLKIVDMPFEGLLAALKSNSIDFIVAGMVASEERKKEVDFSQNYYTQKNIVVIRKENADKFQSLSDLENAKIGAQKATIQEGLVQEQLPNAKHKFISKVPDLILELNNKKVDGVVLEFLTATAYVNNNPDLMAAEISFVDGDGKGCAIALNKNQSDLLEVINKIVKEKVEKDEINNLIKKYDAISKSK